MKRSITTTRLYFLGQFKNLSFSDTIEDIPEELALDIDAMRTLRSIQLFQIERSYLKYMKLRETTKDMNIDSALELINELDVASNRKFHEILIKDVPFDEISQENKGENENGTNA